MYITTDKVFTLEEIVGQMYARWFLVKFEGYDEPECECEYLLLK